MAAEKTNSESSDDECLADLKRKTDCFARRKSKRIKSNQNNRSKDMEIKLECLDNVDDEDIIDSVDQDLLKQQIPSSPETPTETNYGFGKAKIKKKSKKCRKSPFCSQCGQKFHLIRDYKRHMKQHQIESRCRCSPCNVFFSCASDLELHMSTTHRDSNLECHICQQKFQQRDQLLRHTSLHAQEKPRKCDICQKRFLTEQNLDKHHLLRHSGGVYCQVCRLRFDTEESLCSHIEETKHFKGLVMCRYCRVLFSNRFERDHHSRDKHGCENHTFECECCQKIDGCEHYVPNSDEEGDIDMTEVLSSLKGSYETHDDDNYGECSYTEFMNIGKLRKEDLSYPTQCAIVNKMHKGRSVSYVCKLFNLTSDVVNKVWEARDDYVFPKKIGKKSTKYMNSILDSKILEWYYNQKANNLPVTGKMLINIAEEFAKECGFVVFNGNIKWLDRFKSRHKIALRGTQAKRVNVRPPNEAKWKEQFFNEIWSEAKIGYDNDDIYTADEVGVFYNPSKGRIRKQVGKKFIHGHIKDRLSILMCSNATGSDRKKLIVCGTEDPLLHSYRKFESLPVIYIRHENAHFTTLMFEDFVKEWDTQLQIENKNAILILDRASIHTKLATTNLKLVFVPWKASVGLMPIKNGIYTRFRQEFRKLLLEVKAMNVVRGYDMYNTCLDALEMLNKAWNRIPNEVITQSFVTTGYKLNLVSTVTEKSEEIEDNICKWLKNYDVESYYGDLSNFDLYLTVDEDLLTGQGTNSSVFGGNHKVRDPLLDFEKDREGLLPIASEKPENSERENYILKAKALQDLELVRQYLQNNETSHEVYKTFMDIEKSLLKNPLRFDQ